MKKTTKKKITIEFNFFCDESGQLHSNSKKRYFVIGGYYCLKKDANRIKQRYIREFKRITSKRTPEKVLELKAKDMEQEEKIKLLITLQDSKGFNGFAIVVDKEKMAIEIHQESAFYNYFIGEIINKILVKKTEHLINNETEIFVDMRLDTRNVAVNHLKSLEDHLNINYLFDPYSFRTTYCNSELDYCVQATDLIANTIYMKYKNPEVVLDVVKVINKDKIKIIHYPAI